MSGGAPPPGGSSSGQPPAGSSSSKPADKEKALDKTTERFIASTDRSAVSHHSRRYSRDRSVTSPDKASSSKSPARSSPSTSKGRRDNVPPGASTSTDPYDVAYEENNEEDIDSMEGQKSVFSHLLSQVYIGMDLTKVTLPTFILEKRSLLEMYADFFAHPELFVSIVDRGGAKERMVEVVRWYLSAFHAGRKGTVAKKPYNPILGEIFRCYWRIGDKAGVPVPDGPVPWATSNDLCFIAEQVSHHPPVSAFYAEHVSKGICCCAHIWTKSKFLGMSIGVHNVGQGTIWFLRHDEEYVVNFPSGYGRSIFTVPWIELGGTVDIKCEKTGYSCTIEFHTKPMIGGKKHQLTAEIFPPNDKRPFLTVSGEWNGVMTAKNIHGTEVTFVDTTTMPITRKIVQPIKDQVAHESRRLWKDVTLNLKRKDVEKATEAKSLLEDQQRKEAAARKESNGKWETRVFEPLGDGWTYKYPLHKRLAAAKRGGK
ncbi:oxysterol-binding protein-related protein 9-like [Dermacentor variabilis]|uniref:oxysterol-binding protein-related protein 9-like n=1 Tax=Dermacentor variabilis TaxID=34621 RepID=UPI003F5B179B